MDCQRKLYESKFLEAKGLFEEEKKELLKQIEALSKLII
jgi:hypothetical protein